MAAKSEAKSWQGRIKRGLKYLKNFRKVKPKHERVHGNVIADSSLCDIGIIVYGMYCRLTADLLTKC
jgi:hypothetical protein